MDVTASGISLSGLHILLEPLAHRHADGLVSAAANDPELYRWSPVPQGRPRSDELYRNCARLA